MTGDALPGAPLTAAQLDAIEEVTAMLRAVDALVTALRAAWRENTILHTTGEQLATDYLALRDENERYRAAIEHVLADEESRPGGWGPDVSMVGVLRRALQGAREGTTP